MRAALIFSLLTVLTFILVTSSAAAEKGTNTETKPAQATAPEKPVSLPIPPRFWGQWVFKGRWRVWESVTIHSDGRMLFGAYPKDDAPSLFTLRIFRDEIGYTLYAIAQEEGLGFDDDLKERAVPFKRWTYVILDYQEKEFGKAIVVTTYSCDTSEFLFLTGSSDLLFDAIQRFCRSRKDTRPFYRP